MLPIGLTGIGLPARIPRRTNSRPDGHRVDSGVRHGVFPIIFLWLAGFDYSTDRWSFISFAATTGPKVISGDFHEMILIIFSAF